MQSTNLFYWRIDKMMADEVRAFLEETEYTPSMLARRSKTTLQTVMALVSGERQFVSGRTSDNLRAAMRLMKATAIVRAA